MSDAAEPGSSPYGRYLTSLAERILYLPLAATLCLYVRFYVHSGGAAESLPHWYKWALVAVVTGVIFLIIPQWLIPATVISSGGITRNFAARRHTEWTQISDFTIRRAWGVKRVHAQLLNGQKRRLDGVPLSAVPALRHQIGIGGVKAGTWWLVDYSDASSTSSS